MTTELAIKETSTLTREQIDLIKHTVAIGATDLELKLFLYQANKRGLDPLTRQIHFIKRKQYNPDTEKYDEVGTIQTGIDGFRVVANRTGKLSGIKRGVIKSETGKLIGAWAEVYRKDWTEPAREEVSFDEYCQKKKDGSPIRLWASMPETMIKKVAEAAALRMAFPEDLSGIYSHEEMQQADIVTGEIVERLPNIVQANKDIKDLWPDGKPAPSPDLTKSKSSVVESESSPAIPVENKEVAQLDFDPQLLTDMLAEIKWKDVTTKTYLKNQYKVDITGTVVDVVARLTKEQRGQFLKELSDRKQMV